MLRILGVLLFLSFFSAGATAERIKIGLLLDDLRVERWQHDRDYFVARALELGAKVYVKSANGDAKIQAQQVDNMIQRKVDVLVIIPSDASALSRALQRAHSAGIKILSYDRLIIDSPVDLYVSFDNIKVGEMQGASLLKKVPQGRYQLIGGSPSDNNAKMFREGQLNALQPAIDRGDIRIVGDDWAVAWKPDNAQAIMRSSLQKNANKVDAVVASNDGTAGGAIRALSEVGLDGKIPVSGQDADLGALRRIVKGTQTMTVYKPIEALANTCAENAILLANKQAINTNATIDNHFAKVAAIFLEPVLVTKNNIDETVIADGYHSRTDIYQ